MIETIHTQGGETIRTMTPVEYQKLHADAENRRRRRDDLLRFARHLREEMGLMTNRTLPEVVDDYLASPTSDADDE